MAKRVKVTQEKNKEVPTEVLAAHIIEISRGVAKLRQGRLNDAALVMLIQHAAGTVRTGHRTGGNIPVKTIKAVLNAMENLEATYIRKAGAK